MSSVTLKFTVGTMSKEKKKKSTCPSTITDLENCTDYPVRFCAVKFLRGVSLRKLKKRREEKKLKKQ